MHTGWKIQEKHSRGLCYLTLRQIDNDARTVRGEISDECPLLHTQRRWLQTPEHQPATSYITALSSRHCLPCDSATAG
jgi:hypothetical protein